MKRSALTLIAVAGAIAAACHEGPLQPRPRYALRTGGYPTLEWELTTDRLYMPGSFCYTYYVHAVDANGYTIPDPYVHWTISDIRVARFEFYQGSSTVAVTGTSMYVCGTPDSGPNGTPGYGYFSLTATWGNAAPITQVAEFGQTYNGYQPQTETVTPSSADLLPQQTRQLSAVSVDQFGHTRQTQPNWTVDNSAVATVNQSGLVTAVSTGQTSVRATVNGTVGVSTIVVLGPSTITIAPNPATVCRNGTTRLTATVKDQRGNVWNSGTITWSSSNTSVATVAPNGTRQGDVQGVVEGQATITATLAPASGSSALTVSYCAPIVWVGGPYTLTRYQTGRYTAYATNGALPFTYQFRRQDCSGVNTCQPWGSWVSRGGTNYWDVIVFSCGVSHINIQAMVTD